MAKIKATLRQATFIDLFFGDKELRLNVPIFYKSNSTEAITGCYYTNEDMDVWEVIIQIETFGMIYILDYEKQAQENTIDIHCNFIKAAAEDLKCFRGNLAYGKPYYVKSNTELIGPYFLSKTSDVNQLKSYLDTDRLYIIESNQNLKRMNNLIKQAV